MTATTIPTPQEGRFGGRTWKLMDDDEDSLVISTSSGSVPATVVHVYASGVVLTASQCREAAAVLLALADEVDAQ